MDNLFEWVGFIVGVLTILGIIIPAIAVPIKHTKKIKVVLKDAHRLPLECKFNIEGNLIVKNNSDKEILIQKISFSSSKNIFDGTAVLQHDCNIINPTPIDFPYTLSSGSIINLFVYVDGVPAFLYKKPFFIIVSFLERNIKRRVHFLPI